MKALVFKAGRMMMFREKLYQFQKAFNFKEVLLRDPTTGEEVIAPIAELKAPVTETDAKSSAEVFDEEELEEAQRKYEIIAPLLFERKDGSAVYQAISAESKISVATLYRWREKYLETGSVGSLVVRRRGVKKGDRRIDPEVEAILNAVIEKFHLSDRKAGPTTVLEEVTIELGSRGLSKKAPHINTVRNRLKCIDPRKVTKGQEGHQAADQIFTGNIGKLTADYPLEVVMVDHTMLKINIVTDDEHRRVLGPAWITIVLDVYSRMVLGLYITLESPSAQSVGEALTNAILPKEAWLKRLGIEDIEFPVWGKPTCVHADNGSDFRSDTIRKSCIQHRINIQWRPVKNPNWGGHIEAYMKTLYRMFKELPGAIFKDDKERPNYDSRAHAAMTLKETEQYLVRRIIGKYIQERHDGIGGATPLAKWKKGLFNPEKGLPLGLPERIPDGDTLRKDFLRRFERTIGPDGVQIDNIFYFDSVLSLLVNEREPGRPRIKKKFVFRRDDHAVKSIHFWDERTSQYHEVTSSNITMPNASIWEWRSAADLVRDELGKVNTELVVKALVENRKLVDSAKEKTISARRAAERRKRTPSTPLPKKATKTSAAEAEEPADVQPFDDVGSL